MQAKATLDKTKIKIINSEMMTYTTAVKLERQKASALIT